MKVGNRQTRTALAWAVVAAVALSGCILPTMLGMSGMAGGYAISFASGFVCLVALITTAVFAARARILARLLSGQGVLVRWIYPDEDRRRQADKELKEEAKGSWVLFLVIAGFCLVIGIAFWLADPEAGRDVFFVMLGVVALLAAVAAVAPRIRYAKRRRGAPEAIVSREGAYVLGMLHTWRLLGARVEGADVTTGRNAALRVSYSAPMLYGRYFYGRQHYTVTIPIPHGQSERATQVADALEASNGGTR